MPRPDWLPSSKAPKMRLSATVWTALSPTGTKQLRGYMGIRRKKRLGTAFNHPVPQSVRTI